MKKFDTPQINVVKFKNEDTVLTGSTGTGYSGTTTDSSLDNLFGSIGVQAASDQGMDIPF